MTRLLLRLAAAACIAPLVAACSGGGGSHAVPATTAHDAPLGPNAVDAVPQTAARGVMVTVHLPLRNGDDLDALLQRQADRSSSDYRHFVSPEEFRARYAPAAADLESAAATLRAQGFETHVTSQTVLASAPQAVVEHAFGVRLTPATVEYGRAPLGATRSSILTADRAATLPAALTRLGATVGFTTHVHHVNSHRVSTKPYAPANRYSPTGPYWFTDLKEAYGYPSYQTANGSGRTIAIVIDSDVLDSDNALYFGHEHLAPPVVVRRPVNGGPSVPYDPNSGSAGEASLDVQMAYGSAPGARIMLYTIPDLADTNIAAAYTAIVDDNKADVVNSSFGLCELYYTKAYNKGVDGTSILQTFHDIFRQGNAQGITFVASSGDNGAYDCFDPTGSFLVKGVENPADDSNVTAVGGTNLITKSVSGSRDSSYVRESAFADPQDPAQGAAPGQIWGSGGGISTIFAKPWYQRLVNTRAGTRTVPDVSMHMGGCPVGSTSPCNPDDSAVLAVVGGGLYGFVGTSASSPEFAGLLAVTEQTLGTRLGNANGYIYALAGIFGENVYRQDIPGNNGYPTTHDYNYVLGNGTPNAAAFAAQPFAPRAGVPQTPTNP